MKAGLLVDYFGTGELVSAFHPTLQICYMQGSIQVPPINLDNGNSTGRYRFDLPSGLQNPFLYFDKIHNASSYFRYVSGDTWDLYIVGDDYVDSAVGRRHNWSNPINPADKDYRIHFGGYRG